MPSLTDASSRALLSRNPTRSLVNVTASSSRYEELDGFLRLPSRALHANEQSYRSIEKTNANSDSESESDAGESDFGDSSEEDVTPSSHTATLRSINERLAADSRSISNWLSLLSHTLLTVPTTSKNATRARSEISISILARAIAVDGNSHSYVLRLKYLQAGEEIWHESKLRAEWEDALRNVKGVEIWMEWFEWRIRKGTKGISAVVEDAKRALTSHHPFALAPPLFLAPTYYVPLLVFGSFRTRATVLSVGRWIWWRCYRRFPFLDITLVETCLVC